MHILVVDDEYYARKALMQMIQDWNPAVIVDEAEDGQEALDKLAQDSYELVFSDIRMPRLDGIHLAAAIYEHYPLVLNVIVSGYDDFQYAQKAIHYKVQDYLLKPVEREAIFALLQQMQVRLELAAQANLKEQLASLFYEEQSEEVKRKLNLPPLGAYWTAVLQAASADEELLAKLVNEAMREGEGAHWFFRDRRYANMFIVLVASVSQTLGDGSRLKAVLEPIIEPYAEETKGAQISIGISDFHTDQADLTKSYKEAKYALLYRLFTGSSRVYLYEQVARNNGYSLEMLEALLLPLYNKIVKNQAKEATDILSQLIHLVIDMKLSVYTFHDTCSRIIVILNSIIETMNLRSPVSEPYLEPMDLYEYEDSSEVIGYLSERLIVITAKLKQAQSKQDIIEQIKQHVEQNYSHNIVLDDMAKTMFYTDASYLSRLFKKKHGTSFSNFLISVRMNNARSLLETSQNLSIAEVASAVGFNDYSYFIQMYKKFYGETPGRSKRKDQS
jgi:two-component system response regulator YesN